MLAAVFRVSHGCWPYVAIEPYGTAFSVWYQDTALRGVRCRLGSRWESADILANAFTNVPYEHRPRVAIRADGSAMAVFIVGDNMYYEAFE